MELDDKLVFQQKPSINSKLNYFSFEHPYPTPISEGKYYLLLTKPSSTGPQESRHVSLYFSTLSHLLEHQVYTFQNIIKGLKGVHTLY